MATLEQELDAIAAETRFSGVVRIDRGEHVELEKAYGLAHRGYGIANEVDTRFGTASGTKSLTALTVVSLIEEGRLEPVTTARSILGGDLPLIDDRVTVEQLLAHRSGIGDYLDEEIGYDVNDYVMPVPVHELVNTEDYLAVLDGHPGKFEPDERFGYCNGGYVVLAVIAERVSGTPFADLVHERVCAPAGMTDTEFLRSDELPGRTALGYLELDGASRSNVFHLPVRGTGDGGIYTTAADVSSLWRALFAGRIVPTRWVGEMTRPNGEFPEGSMRYGLGFWLDTSRDIVVMEGGDAGVSFRSNHHPATGKTLTVISNTTDGAWPIAQHFRDRESQPDESSRV
jgi:CubicO group peptidase (beta-lactamase class C family)